MHESDVALRLAKRTVPRGRTQKHPRGRGLGGGSAVTTNRFMEEPEASRSPRSGPQDALSAPSSPLSATILRRAQLFLIRPLPCYSADSKHPVGLGVGEQAWKHE